MEYSQGNEEGLIKNYFAKQELNSATLTVLSCGENDGKTLSNSLACIERGWQATLIEPSEKCFKKLTKLHQDNGKVECFNLAIGKENGTAKFYESGEHAKNMYGENHSLLSSLKHDETIKWKYETFTEKLVTVLDFKTLLLHSKYKKFELISIDCEGVDYDILTQIDLIEIGCKMLIVEYNGDLNEQMKFVEYANKYGMNLLAKTYQNLIFVI